MFVAPHCVDVDFFEVRSRLDGSQRAALRGVLGLRTDSLVLLFVGRFIALKRPMDLMLAAGELAHDGLDVEVLYVGAGPLSEALRGAADRLENTVVLTGFRNQTELPELYAVADILVVPSESETWGLVVNEAMACGLPVVVSSGVGCSVDLILDPAVGTEYPVGDVAAMKAAIRQVHTRCRKSGSRARIRAHGQAFRPEQAIEGVTRAVNYLLARGQLHPARRGVGA